MPIARQSCWVTETDSPRAAIPLRLLGLGWAALALGVLVTFWQGPYLFTLASPFRFHLVAGLCLLGSPLAVMYPSPRRWIFLALPMAVGLTFLSYFAPRSLELEPTSPRTKIVVSNILSSNRDLDRLGKWLAEEQPDIVALTEVSEAQRAQLEKLPFAHQTLYPKVGNFGLGLLAKTEPSRVEILEQDSPFPSLLATWPEFRVLVTHPIPPVSPEARAVGDEQMRRLFAHLNDGSSPLLVLGDLNATGWDLRLRPIQEAGFIEARKGHGLLPTWPTNRPMLAIPIDHIFLPPQWESVECRRGPEIGSDHFPLVCVVARPAFAAPKGSAGQP